MEKLRFSVFSGGGNLSFLQAFRDCQKNKTCYNSYVSHQHYRKGYMKKQAFTLAEVLITLGIIGVVAAMTMPTLIANHQKQVYVAGLKKGMSTISNMFQKMIADEEASDILSTSLFGGICINPDTQGGMYQIPAGCEDYYGNPSYFEKIIPQYMKVVKTCTGSECDSIVYKSSELENCDNGGSSCSLKSYGNTSVANIMYAINSSSLRGFYTADGMIYYFAYGGWVTQGSAAAAINVAIDVNGEKGPNTQGRDLFAFSYCAGLKGKIMPLIYGSAPCVDAVTGKQWDSARLNKYPIYHLMSNGYKMDY